MSEPVPSVSLQQRITAAILDAAAHVLAARGDQATMSDVAAAAGVGRATVYRYFPNRQALLEQLGRLALDDAAARLSGARIDEVAIDEGVVRAVRALVDVGDYLLVLARERVHPEPDQLERCLIGPLRRLVERGQAAGSLRRDLPSSWLAEALVGLVVAVIPARPALGRDDTVAALASLFLRGSGASAEITE